MLELLRELSEALEALNELKKKEIIQDYAIGGGYAIIYHNIPYSSYDLDIFAIIVSEDDLRILQPIYKYFQDRGREIRKEHIIIGDMPIQILPNISPLHNNAVEEADEVEINGIPTKIISIEHSIVLSLVAYRSKDRWRIKKLLEKANKELVSKILDRFDDEKSSLYTRYKKILAST
jgi:predicted nucleotidyltransferase